MLLLRCQQQLLNHRHDAPGSIVPRKIKDVNLLQIQQSSLECCISAGQRDCLL